jgi:hypothetical protein
MNKIYENLNKSKPEFTLGIFLDLKKACDLDILLKKIIHYGLSTNKEHLFAPTMTQLQQ